MKLYWFNKVCCVPECFNSSIEGEGCFKEYFDLPAEPQARTRWLNAILTEDGEKLKVCEDHFKPDDIFRDKSNRKKLRLNSCPSTKLPKQICTACLGSKKKLGPLDDIKAKGCKCSPSTALKPIIQQISSPQGKRTRITWTAEEKKTLFLAIKKYGDVRFGNTNIKINWANVVTHCRSNGCFGNEKELKSVWQYIRTNANKVYRNEIFGSKLERKVSRFLYGKPPKWNRSRASANEQLNQNVSTDEDEEFNNQQHNIVREGEVQAINGAIINDSIEIEETVPMETNNIEQFDVTKGEFVEEEESDEYYSISDVEEIFHIRIRPRPSEVISLLSSDDEGTAEHV